MKGVLFYFALFHLFSFISLFYAFCHLQPVTLSSCITVDVYTARLLRKSTREHNKRMKLLDGLASKNATSINIFFQGVRACARSKRCARKYLRSHILSRYSIPEWRTYTNPIRPDPKRFISDLYADESRDIFAFSSRASSIRSMEKSRDADVAFLQCFRYTLPSLIPASSINRRRLDRAFCAHWMIISCVFANKYQHLLPE